QEPLLPAQNETKRPSALTSRSKTMSYRSLGPKAGVTSSVSPGAACAMAIAPNIEARQITFRIIPSMVGTPAFQGLGRDSLRAGSKACAPGIVMRKDCQWRRQHRNLRGAFRRKAGLCLDVGREIGRQR